MDSLRTFHRANDLFAGILDFCFYLPLKPVRVTPTAPSRRSICDAYIAPLWGVLSVIGPSSFYTSFKRPCNERRQMPALWGDQRVQRCILRNMRNAACSSSACCVREPTYAWRAAAARLEPATTTGPLCATAAGRDSRATRSLSAAPWRLSTIASRNSGDRPEHQVGHRAGHRSLVLLRTLYGNSGPFSCQE